MNQPLIILAFVGILILVVAGIVFGAIQARKRREALAALAAELGWRFNSSEEHTSGRPAYEPFAAFHRGDTNRCCYNTLAGRMTVDETGIAVRMGDFQYTEIHHDSKGRRRRTTHHFSYALFHLPSLQIPSILIRQEGFFDKIAGAFGFDDVDFESEEFSRKFYVKSTDKRFAYDLIHPRMMEFLLAGTQSRIEIQQGFCLLWDQSRRWSPEQFRSTLAWFQSFFELWPDHLRLDVGLAR